MPRYRGKTLFLFSLHFFISAHATIWPKTHQLCVFKPVLGFGDKAYDSVGKHLIKSTMVIRCGEKPQKPRSSSREELMKVHIRTGAWHRKNAVSRDAWIFTWLNHSCADFKKRCGAFISRFFWSIISGLRCIIFDCFSFYVGHIYIGRTLLQICWHVKQ